MTFWGTRGILMLCTVLLLGAIIGGLLGDVLAQANFSSFVPYLTKQFTILDLQQIELNLFVLDFTFSLRFTLSILSLLGLVAAAILFRRI